MIRVWDEPGRVANVADRVKDGGCENDTTRFVDHFASGAISGILAAVLTNPFDVLKTRRQMYLMPKTGEVQ